ncbi:MAG: alpha/beta hydrolase [Alphaproteobacteria bacterium]|nr:alpha/beta hydrolase [Alphaproteobacteria bacterium]
MKQRAHPAQALLPAMRQLIERVHRAGHPPMQAMTVAQARAFYEAGAPLLDVPPPNILRHEALNLVLPDGAQLSARFYADSDSTDLPVLVYFHGGGFTIGSPATHDVLCRHLCRLAQCAVVSVNYRLAPEHRFPTAVDDAWHALCQVREQAQALGLDERRMAVGGDSAGGTLAAVCALRARDFAWPLRLQLLFFPGTTAHQDTPSHHRYGQGFMLDSETIAWFFDHYIDQADRSDWRFAPLNAPDHSGLAPVWLGLAECDPLFDEGLQYADVLRMAGVPVDLEIYRGVVHGFVNMGRFVPQALQAHQDAARALREAFEERT